MKRNILLLSFFILGSCNPRVSPVEIKCISNFVVSKTTQKQIDAFLDLDDTEIIDAWDGLTGAFVGRESRESITRCNLNGYLLRNNHSIEDIKGQYFFVHSVHAYLKTGFVDKKKINSFIDSYVIKGDGEKLYEK